MSITKHYVQHRKCEFCTHRYDPRAEDREPGVPLRFCSHACHVADTNARKPAPPPRAQLVTRPSKKRRQAVSPASPTQRIAIELQACVVCRQHAGYCHPAHLIDRSLLSIGQDDPRATIPLCPPCHCAYDEEGLDILAYLEPHFREELAYAVLRFGLAATLRRVTNGRGFQVGCGDKVGPARGCNSPGPRHQEGRS